MTATLTDRAALLAAILEAPEDDAPRLILADHLDEIGEDQFASFIRVQVELARNDKSQCGCGKDWTFLNRTSTPPMGFCQKCGLGPWWENVKQSQALRRRERDLIRHWWRWLPGGIPSQALLLNLSPQHSGPAFGVRFARGFVAEVRCTLAAFVGGPCDHADWRRGLVGPDHECADCLGTSRAPGIAAELFRTQPVTSVRLTDREPYRTFNVKYGWNSEGNSLQSDLPDNLWDLLKPVGGRRTYLSADAAHAALSAACVAYGRSLAGLGSPEPAAG